MGWMNKEPLNSFKKRFFSIVVIITGFIYFYQLHQVQRRKKVLFFHFSMFGSTFFSMVGAFEVAPKEGSFKPRVIFTAVLDLTGFLVPLHRPKTNCFSTNIVVVNDTNYNLICFNR